MAGITDSTFLNKVIPYGFNVATLGGYNLDKPTIEASKKILERGRKEFDIKEEFIFKHIKNEVLNIKNIHPNVKVSCNVRATTPKPIIKASKSVDIIEINCHCRQKEFLTINCGQNMLKRDDLCDFISKVVENSKSEVSVKIRANIKGIDTLTVASEISNCGIDYLHVDAMNPNVMDADYKLLKKLVKNIDIPIIGNNSINNEKQLQKMMNTGVYGFSIARALISEKLSFKIK